MSRTAAAAVVVVTDVCSIVDELINATIFASWLDIYAFRQSGR